MSHADGGRGRNHLPESREAGLPAPPSMPFPCMFCSSQWHTVSDSLGVTALLEEVVGRYVQTPFPFPWTTVGETGSEEFVGARRQWRQQSQDPWMAA